MKENPKSNFVVLQTPIGRICVGTALPYPCAQKPAVQYNSDGTLVKIITASSQLKLLEKDVESIFAPSLYQNCMEPEKIEILPLTLEFLPQNRLQISTRYTKKEVDIDTCRFSTADWQAAFHTTDCVHCTNCGRCGW